LALALKLRATPNKPLKSSKRRAAQAELADAHYGLGATRYDLHDLAAALKELRTAIETRPREPRSTSLLGAHLFAAERSFGR